MKRIGVILAGCGSMDGSEVRESVLTLLALDKYSEHKSYEIIIMAPNENQHHTINHITKEEMPDQRNMMIEASRIARGNIVDIKSVDPKDLSAIIIPGGFGTAKNLSSFAFDGEKGSLHPEVTRVIMDIYERNYPIGVICIMPAVLSLLLGKEGIEVTIGNEPETIKKIKHTGAYHYVKDVNEIYYDPEHHIVSTPAYMYGNAKLHHIAEGINKLVKKIVDLI